MGFVLAWQPKMVVKSLVLVALVAASVFLLKSKTDPLSKKLRHLTKRAQFLNAKNGIRTRGNSFALQMVRQKAALDMAFEHKAGIGYTITKKTGNSPQRNRIKRRLRAASDICSHLFKSQYDYVLIGRTNALTTPFNILVDELEKAILTLHKQKHINKSS